MIQILNNIINQFFKLLKYITCAIIILFWIAFYPFIYASYKRTHKRRNKERWGFYHPNLVLLNLIMKVSKYYDRFIL